MRLVQFRPLIAATAASAALLTFANTSLAETKCGSTDIYWNVPRGAVVVSVAGDTPVGAVTKAIHEKFAHSMISHGFYTASHATRTADIPALTNGGIPPSCSSVIDGTALKQGQPGAEQVSISALYAAEFDVDPKDDPALGAPRNNLFYYDTVDYTTYLGGECHNPTANPLTGLVDCDPIPGCSNPHARPGEQGAFCDPIPSCSQSPRVVGSAILCDPSAACPTGGHIDTTTGAFVCLGTTQPASTCTAWTHVPPICQKICQDGCPDDMPASCTPKCLSWTTTPATNLDLQFASTQKFLPLQVRYWFATKTSVSANAVSFLETLPKTSVAPPGQPAGATPFLSYGIPYDFYQFMNVQGTPYGVVQPGQGVVCSSFIAYAYNGGNSGASVAPYSYTHADLTSGANALYDAIYKLCASKVSNLEEVAFAELCGGRDSCDAAATQVQNCFATGNCATTDRRMIDALLADPSAAPYAISPDHIVGEDRHRMKLVYGEPTYVLDPNEANPFRNDPNVPVSSPWARDFPHPVGMSAGGKIYGCWE